MFAPPLPAPTEEQRCLHCGKVLDESSEFRPHCDERLHPQHLGCGGALKVFLLLICAGIFGALGARLATSCNIGSGDRSFSIADLLFGSPAFIIAALFVVALIREILNPRRR